VRCDYKAVKYSNSLQLTATHCSTLQHTATHSDDGADSWEIYQCAVTIELQRTATHCNTLQHTATHNNNDTDFWKYPPVTLYDGLWILLNFLVSFFLFFRWRWLLRISTSYPLWWSRYWCRLQAATPHTGVYIYVWFWVGKLSCGASLPNAGVWLWAGFLYPVSKNKSCTLFFCTYVYLYYVFLLYIYIYIMYSCTPFFFFVHMCIYYVFLYPVFLNNLYQMIKKWGTKIHSAAKFGTFGNPIVGNPLGAPPREFLRSMCVCVPVSVALLVPLPLCICTFICQHTCRYRYEYKDTCKRKYECKCKCKFTTHWYIVCAIHRHIDLHAFVGMYM
jgi:hypothetical protein